MPPKRKRIDFKELREIPILRVAETLAINVIPVGGGIWAAKLDPANPSDVSSLRIFEKNNKWKRFSGIELGGCSKGSTIDLVMHVKECSFQDAVEFLSNRFL